MDADADDVPGLDGFGVELIERLVYENGVAERSGGSRGENKKPARRDDGVPKELSLGLMRWTDIVYVSLLIFQKGKAVGRSLKK